MLRHLWIMAFAIPLGAQVTVYNTGHPVVGGPSTGTGSIAGGACPGGQVASGLNTDGTPICVTPTATVPAASTSTQGALLLASGAKATQTQVGSTSTSLTAIANQSSPSTYNGLANALASSNCTSVGCVIQVDATYPFDAERGGSVGYPAFTGPQQTIFDMRGGGQRKVFNDVAPSVANIGLPNYPGLQDDSATCFWQIASAGDCRGTNVYSTQPGFNLGSNGDFIYSGWTIIGGTRLNMVVATQGIKTGADISLLCSGLGDCHAQYHYVYLYGGQRDPAAEGGQVIAGHATEPSTHYTGFVASVAGDTVQTTLSGGSYVDLGQGQRIVDTTNPITSGYVTALGSLTDAAGNNNYGLLTITGGTVPASTFYGTLDTAITGIKPIESTGTNTVTTPTTFNVTARSGTPTVGGLLVLGSQQIETVRITGVTTISSGHFAITAGLGFDHDQGGLMFQNTWGRGGLELTQNTVGGLRYDVDCLGATDATHLVCVEMKTGVYNRFSLYQADITQYPIYSLVNTGGVTAVAPTGNILNLPKLQNYSAITIAGAANSAFNGVCTAVGSVQTASFPSTASCTQSSANGQTTTGGSPYFTFGTSGYGTGGFVLRKLARVLDIQTYAVNAAPTVTGKLRLEPHALALNPNDSLSMDHDYAQRVSMLDMYHNINNPYTFDTNLQTGGAVGYSVNDGYFRDAFTNDNNASMYVGLGGDTLPPHGYHLGGGAPWADMFQMDFAPYPSGNSWSTIGCPIVGCNVPYYTYNWQKFRGNGHDDAVAYSPYNHTLTFSQALIAPTISPTGLTPSAAPVCDLAGTLTNVGCSASSSGPIFQSVVLNGGVASLSFAGPFSVVPVPVCSSASASISGSVIPRCYATLSGTTATVNFVGNGSDTMSLTMALPSATQGTLGVPAGATAIWDGDSVAATAPTVADQTGNGHGLTVSGTAFTVVANAKGSHSAIQFNSTSSYYNLASSIACPSCTFYVLYKPTVVNAKQSFTSNNTGSSLVFAVNSSGQQAVELQNTAAIGNDTTSLTAGGWVRLAITVAGGAYSFHLNGVAGPTGSTSVTPDPINVFGANFAGGPKEFVNGLIQWAAFYPGAYNPAVDSYLATR